MKKFIMIILALMLIASLVVPAYAITPSLKIPSITIPNISGSVKIDIPDSVFDKWFEENPVDIEISAPEITEAKYVHAKRYSPAGLEIKWTSVDVAESYEVLITKADGETITYTVEDTEIYDTNADCPRVYIEKTSTWAAASAKVRAFNGIIYSEWSKEVKISCNKLH